MFNQSSSFPFPTPYPVATTTTTSTMSTPPVPLDTEIQTIQLGVEVSATSDEEINPFKDDHLHEVSHGSLDPDNEDASGVAGVGIEASFVEEKEMTPVNSGRNNINFERFPSTSSTPGLKPAKSAPSTPNRIKRSESSSSVIGLLSLNTQPFATATNTPVPSSPLTKGPSRPPSPKVDEGPTIGVLEPEMFTGVETIVVPSEPDLNNYNSIEQLPSSGEERTKFQFSANHNNVTFHRRFPQVDPQERLINYYACALIADILLQGYLYITENYFAFYSNILGLYKTKLLVPVCDVRDITKEKTAIIIPNAVGIETHEGKYVFGSLLSRETTYRLMVEVWKNTISMDTFPFDHLKLTPDTLTTGASTSTGLTAAKEGASNLLSNGPALVPINAIEDELHLVAAEVGAGGVVVNEMTGLSASQSSSLKRTKLIRRTKGQHQKQRSGYQDCCDTSTPETTSDPDYGHEESRSTTIPPVATSRKSPFLKTSKSRDNFNSSGLHPMVNGWRRLSISVKSFRERLKSDLAIPFLHVLIIILLTYLLISTVCMIHRINILQNLFESLTSNPKAQRILNNIQVEQIRLDLSKNMVKMDDLKSSLLNLLDSVEKVFNSNCANPHDTESFMEQSSNLLHTCPSSSTSETNS